MKRAIDNGQMITDLDANFFIIKNLSGFTPPPPELITSDDPRLSDPRVPLDGSVIDDSVADNTGIEQSKLNLSGDIPPNFLGITQAAQGDLIQPYSERNQPNGYAILSAFGKLINGTVPTSGTGTVTVIDIELPGSEFTSIMSESTTTRTLTGYWSAEPAETWFGNLTGDIAIPTFESGRTFTVALIPDFDASKITSGTFSTDQVPSAVGVGVSHAPGLLPIQGQLTPIQQRNLLIIWLGI